MDKEGFRSFLNKRETSQGKIDAMTALVERYDTFLGGASRGKVAGNETVLEFVQHLTRQSEDTFENIRALALFGRFIKNNEVYVTAIQFLDGAEALESLHEKVGQVLGEEKRDEIFEGLELPRLGTPCTERPKFTQAFLERLWKHADAVTVRKLLSGGLRRIPDDAYLDTRRKFLECANLDEYLERRGAEFMQELERIRSEGGLYFNQVITDEVLEFVRANPEIRQGVLRDGVFYETKIPYMAGEYLAETDPRMKRYYYCHCPWVRESIKTGSAEVPHEFCNCSLGYTKQPWQVIFGRQLEGEVLETVLSGGLVCRFAVRLPWGSHVSNPGRRCV